MAPLSVQIKHAGKVYDVQLDPDLPPNVFKESVYQATGVPLDRMKIMVKGGVLKDDSSWKKIGPKAGQTFMVIGAAGDLPKPPPKPTVFLEDMDDAELAEALAKPVGLRNLGNTCYMNASLQALRAIPELQVALSMPALQFDTPLPGALRDLYATMSRTVDSVTPLSFLRVLRQVNPQFAETDRSGKSLAGYAQQDAEECFGQIITTLRNMPGLPPASNSTTGTAAGSTEEASGKRFVDQFLMGEIRRELTCDEDPEEPHAIVHEKFLKLECNITKETNFMQSGIMNSLDQKIEKTSPSLGRQAVYTLKSRITRLPGYLIVHMVRFAWRSDINKKAKIMRRVKFPQEFDAIDLATDELKEKLLPASRRLKEIEKDRGERRKIRKKTKNVPPRPVSTAGSVPSTTDQPVVMTTDVVMGDSDTFLPATQTAGSGVISPGVSIEKEIERVRDTPHPQGGELEDESVYRTRELQELEELINEDVKKDLGCSVTGLYDLVAIVTHKGAAADAGHYIGFVKKAVFHSKANSGIGALNRNGSGGASSSAVADTAKKDMPIVQLDEDDEDWYKFDDDKVSVFPKEKLSTLDGGGEDSSAYVLVYKTKPLA